MQLVLHIGTEKTGSTSIQEFLRNNRDRLYENKIYIPLSTMWGNGNQGWFRFFAHKDTYYDEFTATEFQNDEQQKLSFFANLIEQFSAEINESSLTCDTVIISSEHLSSRLVDNEEIIRLHDFCTSLFQTIKVIIYIREPLSFAISLFSQRLKGGAIIDSLYDANNCTFNSYDLLIQSWNECFPNAEFVVRRFQEDSLVDGDVQKDFFDQTMSNLDINDYQLSKKANLSLSLTGMVVQRRMNMLFPRLIDGKQNPFWPNLNTFIAEHTNDGTQFLPTLDEFNSYNEFFLQSNEAIREKYFPEDEILFSHRFSFSPNKINLNSISVNPEIYEYLISVLWRRNQRFHRRK